MSTTKPDKLTWKRKLAPEKWGQQPWKISDDHIAEMQRWEKRVFKVLTAFDINLSPDLEEKLFQTLEAFQSKREQLKSLPSVPESRSLAENLKNSAEAFARSLQDIRHARIKHVFDIPPSIKSDAAIRALIDSAKQWQAAATAAMPEASTGPKADAFVDELICELAYIYEAATGEKASPGSLYRHSKESTAEQMVRGDFANFLMAVLDAIEKGLYHSPRALVETILPRCLEAK